MKITLSNGDKVREAKLVMLGSTEAGKSSIVNRLIRDIFTQNMASTIGTVFFSKTLQVNDTLVRLQIWDTSGSERYRALAPMYFREADAAIIVYDITSNQSFQEVEAWYKTLRDQGPDNIIIALAGNKNDLKNKRAVDINNGRACAEKHSIPIFMETSALTGENVSQIFTEIAKYLINSDFPREKKLEFISENQDKEKKCC